MEENTGKDYSNRLKSNLVPQDREFKVGEISFFCGEGERGGVVNSIVDPHQVILNSRGGLGLRTE